MRGKHWTWECECCGAKGKHPLLYSTAKRNASKHLRICDCDSEPVDMITEWIGVKKPKTLMQWDEFKKDNPFNLSYESFMKVRQYFPEGDD